MSTFPTKARETITRLIDNGWSFVVNHGVDTGDNPYISIEARRAGSEVRITWHTRATGSYRLFSCMGRESIGGMRAMTLAKAQQLIAQEVAG